MNRKQQEESFNAFVEKQRNTLLSKGDDYAGDDRLSNFKQVGSITGQTAAQACLTLIATKVARLSQLLGGKSPKNESIQDSVLDLGTYASLLNMLLEEENPRVTKEMIGPDASKLFCKQTDINKNTYPEPLIPFTDFLKSRPQGTRHLQPTGKLEGKDGSFEDKLHAALDKAIASGKIKQLDKDTPLKIPIGKAGKGLKSLTEQIEERWGKVMEKERNEAPFIALPKKKKKVKTYKAEDGVVTFKADSIEDALKQLEARGIKVPNGMMLGCIEVK